MWLQQIPLQQNVLQAVWVQDGDASPAQLHKPPVGKLVEHPGDHLAGGADVAGDLLVGSGKGLGLTAATFVQQKRRQALFQAEEEDLLEGPQDAGVLPDGLLVDQALHVMVGVHQLGEGGGR